MDPRQQRPVMDSTTALIWWWCSDKLEGRVEQRSYNAKQEKVARDSMKGFVMRHTWTAIGSLGQCSMWITMRMTWCRGRPWTTCASCCLLMPRSRQQVTGWRGLHWSRLNLISFLQLFLTPFGDIFCCYFGRKSEGGSEVCGITGACGVRCTWCCWWDVDAWCFLVVDRDYLSSIVFKFHYIIKHVVNT